MEGSANGSAVVKLADLKVGMVEFGSCCDTNETMARVRGEENLEKFLDGTAWRVKEVLLGDGGRVASNSRSMRDTAFVITRRENTNGASADGTDRKPFVARSFGQNGGEVSRVDFGDGKFFLEVGDATKEVAGNGGWLFCVEKNIAVPGHE